MSYCVNCGVKLDPSLERCPLCNTPVINPNEVSHTHPVPPFPKEKGQVEVVKSKDLAILLSVSLTATAAVCGLLNLLVFSSSPWSLYVIGACLLLWVLFIPAVIYTRMSLYASLLLDGLAAGVTVMTAAFLAAASIGTGARIEPAACAVAGALLGFLLFNVYPASVFMGDTGSLALGGFVAASAYMMRMQLFIPIISFVYLAEVVSVILQVAYFKLTGGRRLFKMAPLHHHFELCGWPETRIVAFFSILTAILCLAALLAI